MFAQTTPLLLQAEGQTLTPLCAGQAVQVEGNHNVIKPYGRCLSLVVKGVANQIALELGAGATIHIEGGDNQVTYRAPALATVEVLGTNDTVTPNLASASGPSVGLQLTGDDQAHAVPCAGLPVTIQGTRGLYVLRGGCKSLTVRGDLLTVQAEMAPGAPITVTGRGNQVGWALSHPGQAPAATLHGEGNHVLRLTEIGGSPLSP